MSKRLFREPHDEAQMRGTTRTSEKSKSQRFARLVDQVNSAATLLSALASLPASEQDVMMSTNAGLVNRLATDLASLIATAPGVQSMPPPAQPGTFKDSLNAAFNTSEDITCTVGIIDDLLHLAFSECERQTRPAIRIDSAMRAIERYVDDIRQLNETLQFALEQLEKIGGAA
jgi:hypothetical protein